MNGAEIPKILLGNLNTLCNVCILVCISGSALSEDLLNNDCNGDAAAAGAAPVDIRVIPPSPNGGGKRVEKCSGIRI